MIDNKLRKDRFINPPPRLLPGMEFYEYVYKTISTIKAEAMGDYKIIIDRVSGQLDEWERANNARLEPFPAYNFEDRNINKDISRLVHVGKVIEKADRLIKEKVQEEKEEKIRRWDKMSRKRQISFLLKGRKDSDGNYTMLGDRPCYVDVSMVNRFRDDKEEVKAYILNLMEERKQIIGMKKQEAV